MIILLFIIAILPQCSVVHGMVKQVKLNKEKMLISMLKENYSQKYGRPMINDSDGPLEIQLKIQLIQIVKLDATEQVLLTNVWNNFHWNDPYLSWNKSEYNGLGVIRIPASVAFEHDIQLLNNADERLDYKRDALLVIYDNGQVLWIPRSLFSSTCFINLKLFPFDQQKCQLEFGSWSYDSTLVDLNFYDNDDRIDLNDYEQSKEWRIQNSQLYGIKSYRIQNNKNYSVLTYFLILDRNPGFYTYLLIFPCVLLAILTMVVFWLPPETPSKIILGMNIFAGFFLLLLLLAELVPTSSNEVPYIGEDTALSVIFGIYFCLNMVMIALSSFLCTIVVHLYFRADTFCKMPSILKKIFLEWLARLFFMHIPKSTQTVTQRTLLSSGLLHGGKNVQNADKFEKFELLKERFKSYRENVLKIGFNNLLKTHPALTGSCNNVNQSSYNIYSSASSSPTSSFNNNLHKQSCCCSYCAYCSQQQAMLTEIAYLNNLEHDIKEIRDYLRDTRKKLETKELKVKLASDWKQIALVLDRTFFFIYLFITVITLFIMFPKSSIQMSAKSHAASQPPASADEPASVSSSILSTLSDAVTAATMSFRDK